MAHWIVDRDGCIRKGEDRVCSICHREFKASGRYDRLSCHECLGSSSGSKGGAEVRPEYGNFYGCSSMQNSGRSQIRSCSFLNSALKAVTGIALALAGLFAATFLCLYLVNDESLDSSFVLSGIVVAIVACLSVVIAFFLLAAWSIEPKNRESPAARAGQVFVGTMGIVALGVVLTFLWSNPSHGAIYDVFRNGRYVNTAYIENWQFAFLGTIGSSVWLTMFGAMFITGLRYFVLKK